MHRHLLPLLPIVLAGSLTAQITYVDADPTTNTTNADGTPITLAATHTGTDNLWAIRTNAVNNGSTINSNDDQGEDSPMLRQVISGLTPGAEYNVYFYLWGIPTQNWRGRAEVGTTIPGSLPPGFLTNGPSWSTDIPMQPLGFDAYSGPNGPANLGLNYDPTTFVELDGHFSNQVVIAEGFAHMLEGHLGVHAADANGEIWVYVEDHPNGGFDYRTWFDGVGYELAPTTYGNACGTGEIGMTGVPHRTTNWSIDLTGSDPNSLAVLAVGFAPLTPFDLGNVGFTPGCYLNVDYALLQLGLTDANGDALYSASVTSLPISPATLYFQWAVFDGSLALTSATNGLAVDFHY